MPIQVTCPGCLKRFTVNDKFAGKSGPCPNCRKVIKIPEKADEVVIHAPEVVGPKDSKGKSVLKPLRRKEVVLSVPVLLSAILSSLVLVGIALAIRFSGQEPATAILVIGAILLAPPLVFVGYWFLRDDELEGFKGRQLIARCGICAALFAGAWLLYALVPKYVGNYQTLSEVDSIYLFALLPIMIVVGTAASVIAMELEIAQGLMHYMLYLTITIVLALLMGTKLASPFAGQSPPTNKRNVPTVPIVPNTPVPSNADPTKSEEPRPKINILQ
jgi:hypothetical protein